MENIKITIKKQVKWFTCIDIERINEGLQLRNIDADSIISIDNCGAYYMVWYKVVLE